MASKSIVAKGTTFNGVESVTFPVSGGGNATFFEVSDTTAVASDVASGKYFYTSGGVKTEGTASGGGGGGDSWNWMGKNPTKVATCLNEKNYLKDTGFATWTPTTTATTLVADTTLTSQSADFNSYDYVVLHRFHTHFDYTATGNARVSDYFSENATVAYAYPTSLNGITDNTVGSPSNFYIGLNRGLFYINSSGNNAYATSNTYGIYASDSLTPSLSSSGTITPNVPAINARCSSTYFSTASAALVDQNTSYYEQTVELWRVDRGTSPKGAPPADVRDMWLNGF